ncbi:MAG TPA: 3'-5' exonuclease, partial [Spirochaetota bacterium]|nr:3'-5' exonuclease [Spirochaetota bacterium]
MYAVIDLETTGLDHKTCKITEITVLLTNGEVIKNSFSTLLNPGVEIPTQIIKITGINNNMVARAPCFAQIADKIKKLTANTVLVSHNAKFDYAFLKKAFAALNRNFDRKLLCTWELSKKLLPDLPSYSLLNLCNHFDIKLKNH